MADDDHIRSGQIQIEPRKGGRPRADDPGGRVSTWLPTKAHDELIKLARDQRQSVSSTVRDLVLQRLGKR